jgi:hypothetical protein
VCATLLSPGKTIEVSKLNPVKSSGIAKPVELETVKVTGAPANAGRQAKQMEKIKMKRYGGQACRKW